MTSQNSWQISLGLLLNQARSNSGGQTRVAVMGIGNELRGDDAAGMLVARCLFREDTMMVIQAGQTPENATAELRGFAPQLILLVDAADMGEPPGTVRWIAKEDISGISASTHNLPLSMLGDYLMLEFNCPVALLGIQPASNDLGGPVSPEVLRAVDKIVTGITDEIFRTQFPSCASDGSILHMP
jgi:hydrogenase 3 maturation protease